MPYSKLLILFCMVICSSQSQQVPMQSNQNQQISLKNSLSDTPYNACQLKLVSILANLYTQDISKLGAQDYSVLLFSGKSPFDLGSKEMCDLVDGVHFLTVNLKMSESVYIGVCIYQQCREEYINDVESKVLQLIVDLTGNQSIMQAQVIAHDKTSTKKMQNQQQSGFIATVIIIGFFAFLGIGGIIVEYTHGFDLDLDQLQQKGLPLSLAQRNDKQLLNSKSKCGQCLISFSVTRNFRKLMSTKGGGDGYDDNLEVFAGIRTFSMMYVIFGHLNLTLISGINYADIGKNISGSYGAFVQGAFYSVDAFFCMAGFLGTYVLLGKLAKTKGCLNVGMAYFHRWYRLAPALGFLILSSLYLFPFLVSGPVAYMYKESAIDNCNKYWWTNLLFINNLYPWDMNDQCVGWTWYLANDFQFFLFTPFILMIMHRSKFVGFIVNISLIILSIFSGIIITYVYDFRLPSSSPDFSSYYYEKPYTRMASYMVGVLLAQFYYDRKLAKNGDYNAINSFGNKLFMLYARSKIFTWISAILGLFLCLFMIFIYQTALAQTWGQWSLGVSMVYDGFSRPLFVFGMMIVLFPTFEGQLSWLKIFLSNAIFKVIGKLTYCAYLMHFMILFAYGFSIESTAFFSKDFMFAHFLGFWSLSYLTALIVSLLLQSPILTLEKTILFPPKEKKPLLPEFGKIDGIREFQIQQQSKLSIGKKNQVNQNGQLFKEDNNQKEIVSQQ